jgi:hypothetical protein
MKKILLVAFFFAASCTAICQQMHRKADSTLNLMKTGDDKFQFAPILGAVANMVGNDGQTILLQPTLFSIGALLNPSWKIDSIYRKKGVLRSIQLNLGVTASETSIFKYDSARLGFSVAILNNKTIKKADYDRFMASTAFTNYKKIQGVLVQYSANKIGTAGETLADKFFREGITEEDFETMPADLKAKLVAILGTNNNKELAEKADIMGAYKNFLKPLTKRSLLVFDFSSNYDFQNKDWGGITITPANFYHYFFKSWKNSPAFNASVYYNFLRDTVSKEPLKRRIWGTDIGVNFSWKNKDDESVFEIKPALTYSHIIARAYDKEKISDIDPSATFRFRVNKNFYIPIKVLYDTEEGDILGFLSIQFALK